MIDWDKKFNPEYRYARGWLQKQENFAKEWQPLVKRLHGLMGEVGFNGGDANALVELRNFLATAKNGRKASEERALLEAVGGWSDDTNAAIEDKAKMRASALKLLRHVYMLSKSGSRAVWVVALPREFRDWPSDDINARGTTQGAARVMLASRDEIFSEEQKKQLGSATFNALAWCHRATAALAAAGAAAHGKGTPANNSALAVVKRWFADPAVSESELKGYIDTLQLGFKQIIAMLNRGQFVLTDWVPLRTASAADELSFLNSEAFTFPANAEGMDVVYIERSFFVDHPGNVLKGQRNWIRILVHELSHLVCGTEGVPSQSPCQIENDQISWCAHSSPSPGLDELSHCMTVVGIAKAFRYYAEWRETWAVAQPARSPHGFSCSLPAGTRATFNVCPRRTGGRNVSQLRRLSLAAAASTALVTC